jgi:hypothetical protein
MKQRWGLEQGTVQSDDGTRHPKHRLAKLGAMMGVKKCAIIIIHVYTLFVFLATKTT